MPKEDKTGLQMPGSVISRMNKSATGQGKTTPSMGTVKEKPVRKMKKASGSLMAGPNDPPVIAPKGSMKSK
jgi:hypothetical protein